MTVLRRDRLKTERDTLRAELAEAVEVVARVASRRKEDCQCETLADLKVDMLCMFCAARAFLAKQEASDA